MLFHNPIRILLQVAAMLIMPAVGSSAVDPFQPDVPSSVVERLEGAKAKRAAGQVGQALTDFRQIVKEHPDYYRAQYNLGLALAEESGKDKKKLGEAIATLEKARDIMEHNSLKDYSIYNSLGWYYARANRGLDAEKAYNDAVKHGELNSADTNRRLYTNLGIFYLERGDLDHARQYLQIAANNYQSESARKFLEINESVRKKTELPEGLTYQAKLSNQDKANSKGVRFVDHLRKEAGPEAAVLETLLQDRANFYHYDRRDAEDEASPGLESSTTNRVEFRRRDLKFVGITADQCLDQEPVVKVTLTKDTVLVSRSD